MRNRRLAGDAPRPPLTGRVFYLVGGTLPADYTGWVVADCTGPGWRVRQATRPVLMLAPFALVFLLLPGRLDARITVAVLVLLTAVATGFASGGYFRNRRLVQHGLPPVVRPEEDPEPDEPGPAAPGESGRPGDSGYRASANVSTGISTRAASVMEPDSDG